MQKVIDWFEIPVSDMPRAQAVNESVLGAMWPGAGTQGRSIGKGVAVNDGMATQMR